MAKGFNLTAELNLRGPGNLKQIASAIRREIGTVDATVKVKLDKSAERSILNTSNALARLNKELQITAQASALTTNNITSLVGAINNLGGALNGSNSSMSQIVSSAQATTQQMARLKKGTVEARSEMEEFGRQSALAVRRFAAFNFATGVIFGLIGAVSKATSEFIEFDKQIVRLTQITGESYEQLSRITATITGLSTGLGVASSDLIKISDTLAQAGFSARETDQALRALALTALAPSFENLNETVEGSIALMRQFKISTEDLDKALGSINAVAAGFAVEASDIITAIQRTGGVFAAASKGVSQGTDALNEFIAVFTSVRATTRESAETIATGLRTIFTRIQREDTIDALREYGVNLLDVEGKFVGAYKAVQLLSQGLSKLDPRDTSFSRIVEELGGFRQIGKVLPLIQEFATAQQALGVAQRGQSSLAQDAIKAQSSLAVQFSKTRESFVALIRDIGNSDSFKTLVSLGLTLANTFIRVADVAKPLLPIITAIGAIKGAKALTSYVGGFVGGLRKVKPSSSGPAAGGEDQAAAARSQQIADSYTNNSTALNNTTSALNNLTTAISPLTASIDNLGNGVMTQLLNEITSLNNNLSSLPPGGGGATLNRGGVVRKFAKGGSVPGSGNTDSVPALLTPGEFVVNKKSARAVGSKNLHRINGYANGGPIRAGISSIEDIQVADGDTFDAMVTPKGQPFKAKFRMGSYDAYEKDNKKSRITASKLGEIKKYNTRSGALDEIDDSVEPIKIPSFTRVKKGTTAKEAAEEGKQLLTKTLGGTPKETLVDKINQTLDIDGGFGRYIADLGNILPSDLTTGRTWKTDEKHLGGLIQKFAEGGVAQRRVGYIDYDVIANEANKDIVEKGMRETGSDGPRIYSDYLTKLAVNARKSANIQKLRAIYGVAGSGKTTLARGQGTDNAKLRQTERFPILSPEDIQKATEILILTSSVSKTKMDDFFGDVDRAYTLSSTTDAERSRVKDQRGSRDVTGIGLEGRQPGTTMGVSTDTAVGEALLSDKLGDKSVVLGRSGSGRLRRKSGDELVDIIKKRIGFTWGGFAPTTAGHESLLDAAAAMGIPPEDFIALVGANEAVDASSYRTAIFDQDSRVLLAKAGFGARGAAVLPKPRDFEVPQGFDITQQGSDRRQVLLPDQGSTVFVADKTEKQIEKYKEAGYGVKTIERTGGISGTAVRDLMIAGDMAKLQSVLSPGVYDLISNNIGRIQNRSKILPSLIKQAQEEAQGQISQVDQQIEALGIKRIDSEQVESDPEYAAKVEVLKELRSKKQKMRSAAGFTPYKLLDALAQKDPQNYALDFSASAIMGNVPGMRTMGQNSQAPEAPMPVGRVAQLAQEKNKSIQDVILEQLGGLGGPAGVKRILGIGSGDRTLSSLLQAGNIKGGKGLEQAADYVNRALAARGIRDAAEAKRLEEYQAKALHFGIAGLLPMDYSKEFEWDIGGTNVYATARGFGSTYLEEARQMQKESSELAQRFAENVQNKNIFGGGEKLAFDFDKTLVEDADILDANGKPDIAKYSNRDAVAAALQKARPTRLAAKLKSLIEQDPPFIKKTRILTARPQSTADLLAQSLQSFGLPYSATDITGVSGGASSNIAALKAANLQQEEKLIDDSLDNIMAVRKAGKKGFQYTEPKPTTSELDEKMGQGNIEGAIVEKALAVLGAPVRPDAKQNRAIDYPDGLGSAAQFFPGIDPGIPTEVKRTIDGTSLEKVREEIGRYITGGAETVKLADGGIATKTKKPKEVFGTGETKFPARISKKYAEEQRTADEFAKSKLAWEKNPKDERIMVDENKVQEAYQQPFDRERFASSFKEKISRDSLFERMSDFAKFVGLPQEDLSVALPLQLDFGASKRGGGLGMFAAAEFSKGAAGVRPYEGYDLSKFGYGEKEKQEVYGLEKLIAAKEKEIKKIRKTPTETFDDGSFSFDSEAFQKTYIELDSLKNRSFKLKDLKREAEKAALAEQNNVSSTTGRGTVSFASSMGYSSDTKNSTLYHEMTHQLFEGLRTKSAESFDKYRSRVSSLFSGDNDDLADAFDTLTAGGGYSSADVVYGRSYKSNNLSQILSSYYRQNLDSSRGSTPIPEDITKNLASLSTQSTAAKRAREYRPINPKVNEALLQSGAKFGMTQQKIDRMEDNGKEEFLTTLIEKAPQLDQNLQGILDSTLTELLSGAGIQRQKFAVGGKASRGVDLDKEFMANPVPSPFSVKAVSKKLGPEVYGLEKGSGLSSFEFDDAKRFADSAGYNIEEFKKLLAQRAEAKKQRSQIKTNSSALLQQLTPQGRTSSPKQLALAEQLKDTSNDIGYRPSALERIAQARNDINNAIGYAAGGVAEAEKKKEKEYGQISISEDSGMISVGYKQNETRSGYATAYKMRDNLYYVGLSKATSGYGPKLYDVLMEAATEKGAMLTSDRSSVSDDAKGVWEYYFKNRGDVKKTPLKPSDWTVNESLIDPKLYGKESTWPPASDPAWVLQTGYSKSPSLINDEKFVQRLATGGVAQLTPPSVPSPPKKPDPNAQVKAVYQDEEMDAIKKKWPIGTKIASGEWKLPGHKSIGIGQFAGDHKELTDFGGSGWKMRLDPKTDNDNILIADWFGKNKSLFSGYKIATNTDHPVWSAYVSKGTGPEIQKAAKKAQADLGKFITLNQTYDTTDTIIPETGISGRFEIRGDERSGTPRANEIVDTINERRKATTKYKNFYLLYKQSPGFQKGFPSSTSGQGGVPGTHYFQWLMQMKKDARRGTTPERAKEFQAAQDEEIKLIESVLKEKTPEYSFGSQQSSSPKTRLAPPPPPPPPKKFAIGGIVPGTGNRDTVPASLTPGDFVIRKSSVKKLGLGGSQGFASGGQVPALLTPGELVVPQAQAKKIGYGKLNTMNKYGRYNKGGAVGIQRFEMGGEALTGPEMSAFRSSMATVMATFSDEVSSAVDKIDLPTIDTSSWESARKSLIEIQKIVRSNFATLGDDVVTAMRAMTSAGNKALSDIELNRVKTRQSEMVSSLGWRSGDLNAIKKDVDNASNARSATFDRKRKNNEREAEGKAPFPVLDLMEMMRSAVGHKPDPINVKPPVSSSSDDDGMKLDLRGVKPAEDYRSELDYSDVSGKPGNIGPRGELYAQALAKQDPTDISTVVKELRTSFEATMASLGKTISPAGQSQSWATWDIGKQLHMWENPQESSDKYKLGNPLDDAKLRLQMVQRQVGYEVSNQGERDGKKNNIPSFELVEIGAKAMAESFGKNEAALDAFVNTLNNLNRSLYTKEDILGPPIPPVSPTHPFNLPPPSGVPTAPPVPVPPIVPPTTPPTVPPTPPVPPSPPTGAPLSGDEEAAVQRYMMEMETAAKAVKIQTYQVERLAGATATEAKARADAASQAAAQAIAQQRLVGATTEEIAAITEATARISQVRGGVTLTPGDTRSPAQSLARGGAPAPDTTDYAKAAKANADAITNLTSNFTKFSIAFPLATSALSNFVGSTTIAGKVLGSLSTSIANVDALFIAADEAIQTFTSVATSDNTKKYLESFSSYLIDAGRKVENFASGFSGSSASGFLDRIASGLGKGGGMVGKLAGNLPQIASGVSGALSSLAGPVGLAVTAFQTASSIFIGITDSLRQSKLDASIKAFDDNLKYAEQALDSYSKNTVDNAGQLQIANTALMNAAREARTQSDITRTNPKYSTTNIIGETLALGGGGAESRAQRSDILDQKGMMAYIGSLVDVTGTTQSQYTRELIPQKAAETAEKFKKPAELQQRVFEQRFEKGESSSDIMKSPDWKQQAEVLARSNAETEQQLRSIDADLSLSKQARDAKREELMSIAAVNSIRDQEVKYIRNRNTDEANKESAKLLYGLDRMLGNMEQSISSVTYAMSKLSDQTDLLKASMTGEAKIGATRIDASNVLQNPNMYSIDQRSQAADVGSQFFGPQAKDMQGLLQFGPDLENTILSTINSTIQEDPGASSGKIEARISQNIEKDLSNLNIDEALKKTLAKDISSALSDSQKKGEDKIDYQQVFGEASAFGKTVQATKKAQEAALKALEFYQQSVNSYAQSMNEAVALQVSSNEKMRRADDIRVRGEMTLAKTLGKSISLESSKSAANAGVMSQAGTADPRQIMNNIGRLEMTRQNQQASVDASAQRGPRGSKDLMAFTSQLSGTTMQLRENYAALKSLAESTEVADAALAKMSEIKAKNEAGLGILERFISSTPKEQAKLNQSFERLDRNMNGQANNMWDSMRVQEAYNEALKNGGSMQDAQEAADQAAAQDRGDTMEAFKMLAPYLGDNQNQLKANMLQSMMAESGVEMSPMFNQVLEGLRNPESDPQMAAALNEYKIANDLQVQANQYLAMLDGQLAQDIGAQAQVAFSNALSGVQQSSANANAKDTLQGINNLNGHLRSGVTKVTTVSSGTREAPDIPGMAKGGVVEYLAVGGSIFKPKGSDTVPAMLTPGEFVVNKRAASSNGPLLNAINNGYSKGGSVKYYADGGWVSSMLRPETDRFSDSKETNPLYTKFNDFSTFGDPKSVIKNLEGLKADEGLLQFIRPYSYPIFNGTDSDLFQSALGDMEGPLNKQIGSSQLGILPDFYLSRQVVNKALKGAGYGAAAGAMVQGATSNVMGFGAGSLGSVGATAAATATNDTGSSLSGYLWEAMKFVPGLGGVISGIDAVRALLKGDILGGVLEGLSAVMNLIPIPGAGVLGKGITKALGWGIKWIPGFKNLAKAGGRFIPDIFKRFAPGLYDNLAGFLNGNLLDVIMKFIPGPIKKRLGMSAGMSPWKAGASSATEAIEMGATNATRNALKYAVPGGAAIGATVGGAQAMYEGATPVEVKGVAKKLQELTSITNIKYPEQFSEPKILTDLITKNTDALSLEEAKKQVEMIKPWADSLKEADQWEKVKDIPSAKVKVKKGAYTQYDFGPDINASAKEYMYARVGKGNVLPEKLFPNIESETGLLRFTTSGYPTLKTSDPNVSASTDAYLKQAGRSFKPEGLSGGNEDFSTIYKELQDYYEDLSEINPMGTTSDKYNTEFWTPKAPAQQKESKRNSILSALVDGTKLKYSFDQKDLADTSLFKWGTSDVKPPDGSKPEETNSSKKLTVYGKAIRSQWADMTKGEVIEKAVTEKRIWGGDPETGFKVFNSLDNAQVEPLPWTTDESFFSQEMMQALQKQHETDLQKKIGLKISPPTSYNKLVDLPSSKRKLPVFFDFQNFESIPLMNFEDSEYTEDTPKAFLPDGLNATAGLFIKNRATNREGVVNPFQMLSQGSTEYPYFSSESALDAAVQQWAASNFDLPDFSLAGIKLATSYNPIVAEKAFKPSNSIKSARTSRKGGNVTEGNDASDAARILLGKGASESLLFYGNNNEYKVGDNIPYSDAKNIIMGKLPGLSDAMQKNAVRDMTMTKDEKRKKMQAEAAKVSFKPEHVPLLANKVWQKTKTTDIPMINGLKTASDWMSAASEDGMSPPEEIKNQTELLDAVDYISWIKSKVLSVTEKARSQGKEKLQEVQNMASETAFGKYMSAGRFMSQLASQSENVGGSNTTISQASERLYSKYGAELDKWTTKEKIVTTTVKGADADGVSIGDKSKTGGDQKFWNIPKIIETDASFVDFILGFANQQRAAQRFDQLITGNGNAKLTDVQTNAIGGIYEKFTGQAQAVTDDKSGVKGMMKAVVGDQVVDMALPKSIADVKAQFMDENTVYPPEYRDVLGDTLMQLGDRYATKWSGSGDPGTEEWSTVWAEYSDQLAKLQKFLVYRDELLIRPIAVNKEDKLYPPAVMPAITGSMIPIIAEGAKKAGLPAPEIDIAALQASIPDPSKFSQYLKDNIFKIAGVGTGAEDYKARDSISAALAAVDAFYNDNFAPTALPRVYTEEGNNLWQILEKLYSDANTAYSTFSGGVVGEGTAASDTTVQLRSLSEIYDKNTMPSAQGTMYGLAYNTNKKFGTNNTIEAMQREKEAGKPKPEVSSDSVATQAVANAGSMPEVGVPPDASRAQVEQVAGEEKKQEPVAKAKGGLIYRAVGGPAPINWTPRGTDTVPAMLTPGEYVINRSSTQKYLPILEAINNGNSSQGAIAAAVQAGGVPATSYASRGGVISPRYFDRGGGVTSASGVSNSYSMGFDSATLAAIKQFDTSVQAFGEALSQLSIGNIKLDEAALSALGDFATKFDQFTQSLLKLNVPPVISITGQHEVNVNLNGAAIFSTMEESMQHMIVNEINKAFNQLSKDNEGGIAMNYRPGPPTA